MKGRRICRKRSAFSSLSPLRRQQFYRRVTNLKFIVWASFSRRIGGLGFPVLPAVEAMSTHFCISHFKNIPAIQFLKLKRSNLTRIKTRNTQPGHKRLSVAAASKIRSLSGYQSKKQPLL
ncbi:hypothetical protein J6590_027330 [Homalodisca vitripennis]|nr:hypothetical protein J6590_027330 [Homalodisca vitripennis]